MGCGCLKRGSPDEDGDVSESGVDGWLLSKLGWDGGVKESDKLEEVSPI